MPRNLGYVCAAKDIKPWSFLRMEQVKLDTLSPIKNYEYVNGTTLFVSVTLEVNGYSSVLGDYLFFVLLGVYVLQF